MWVVPFKLKIFSFEIINRLNFSKNFELWERSWFSLKLSFQRLNVVQVNMSISQSMYKITWLQAGDVRDHVGEQGIAGDVEGHAQAHVSRPLVQLAGQLPIHHIELAEGMARGQRHQRKVFGIPGTHDDSSVIRVGFDGIDHLLQLVYSLT